MRLKLIALVISLTEFALTPTSSPAGAATLAKSVMRARSHGETS